MKFFKVTTADFEDGNRGHEPKNVVVSRKSNDRKQIFLLSLQKQAALDFSTVRLIVWLLIYRTVR